MAVFLTPGDLAPFATIDEAKAEEMITDATAMATLAAPCLAAYSDLDDAQRAAVRAILRGAILRWHEAGSGALAAQQAGPFGMTVDTRQQRRGMFWPSEIEQLQSVCTRTGEGGAFTVDTVATTTVVHADICALRFGGTYCSCGAVLTYNLPLYEDRAW